MTWKSYGSGRPLTKAPEYERPPLLEAAELYEPSAELAAAVDVAVSLGMPLLVTGDPGTGKTQLAYHIAHRFGQSEPIAFQAKTTSTAQDLFYRYDALSHFHESTFEKQTKPDVMRHVEFQALGLAILLALDPQTADTLLPAKWRRQGPRRSVVLIDEIDKAPRDLPNDILREIETMSFTVKEAGLAIPPARQDVDPRYRPIVILTSNSEKHLPDAFLRRCAYFHINFPDDARLRTIIDNRVPLDGELFTRDKVDAALTIFRKVREAGLRKKPATAELLAWLQMLNRSRIDISRVEAGDETAVGITSTLLATTSEDIGRIRGLFPRR
jgi:MoxR-like ATPase